MEIYRGLVLAERSAGEQGKFIDVLTEHNTVQEIYVRGAKKNSSAGLSATQLFSYATFSVQKRRNQWYLDSAEPIRIFYRLRESLSRLSLAMYFGELIRLSVREHQTPEENCFVMRLMLSTLTLRRHAGQHLSQRIRNLQIHRSIQWRGLQRLLDLKVRLALNICPTFSSLIACTMDLSGQPLYVAIRSKL